MRTRSVNKVLSPDSVIKHSLYVNITNDYRFPFEIVLLHRTQSLNHSAKMPAIRLTLASNANQSTKCPILIPASASTNPTASSSVRALVFKSAQTKLRVKKPTRVFVGRSGQELVSEADWKSNTNNDVVLLVSAGEDYVGARKVSGVHGK